MRPSESLALHLIRVIAAAAFLGASTSVCAQEIVPGQANIFGAGHQAPPDPGGGGAGVMPIEIGLGGPGNIQVTFPSVTGLTNCCNRPPDSPPDGGDDFPTSIQSWDGISGIAGGGNMFLVGVFLDDNEPSDPAPPLLNFDGNEDFEVITPEIAQLFFIGDGLTGNGEGTLQTFIAPPGATRLFLGFADAFGFGGLPGYYGDNTGELGVTVDIQRVSLDLQTSGACPGTVTATISNATPGGAVALVYSRNTNGFTIPANFTCGGTQLDLGRPVSLVTVQNADPDGELVLSGAAPPAACGGFLQAVDATTCETSNVSGL